MANWKLELLENYFYQRNQSQMNDYLTIYLAIYPNEFASKTVVQFKRTGKRYKVYDVVVTREEDDKQ